MELVYMEGYYALILDRERVLGTGVIDLLMYRC
jgi:hypothetical protein